MKRFSSLDLSPSKHLIISFDRLRPKWEEAGCHQQPLGSCPAEDIDDLCKSDLFFCFCLFLDIFRRYFFASDNQRTQYIHEV